MSVIERLQQAPESFSFLQVLRLLELTHSENRPARSGHPTGAVVSGVDFRPPAREPVRIGTEHSLGFPAAEVSGLQPHANHWQLKTAAFGLDGATGPLPFHYTELLQERHKARDFALTRFLDLFNHRSTSLFWRALSKYRLPLEYERGRRHRGDAYSIDRHTHMLLSLLGLSPELIRTRGALPSETLLYYGGLLSQQVKTAGNLKQMLQGYFQVPATITEFNGTWCEVLPEMRCRLPAREHPGGQNNCLGQSTLLGRKSWLAQNTVGITLGPLNDEQYQRFAPGSRNLRALNELSNLYLGADNQFDVTLRVKASALPRDLTLGTGEPARLGWNSRLPESIYRPASEHASYSIPVSASDLTDTVSPQHGNDRNAA